jgi:phytoene/squalene synthetase
MTGALNDLLKATSRSFYLTFRVLPSAVRQQIGLAYPHARTGTFPACFPTETD